MDARNIGLRNIEVADTKICSIDGEQGKLIYRGYDILDLVNHSTFEETTYLLLFGELPNVEELAEFSHRLREARRLPESVIKNLKTDQEMHVLWMCFNHVFQSWLIMI
jgi:citrate synthase